MHDVGERPSLPPSFAPSPLAEIVVLSDFWSPIGGRAATIAQLSATGAHGHVVQIVDPAEETFPYSGRVEFVEPEGAGAITAGRAETWRTDYEARIARHRAEIRAETDRLGWSFAIHRTDRPASELLLALHARMGAGPQGTGVNRWHAIAQPGRHRMMGLPLAFAPAAGAARAVEPAGAVVAAAADPAAAAPHRLPADAAAVRHRAEGGDALAHAVVAHAAAARARRAGHHRRRRADVESAGRDLERRGARSRC